MTKFISQDQINHAHLGNENRQTFLANDAQDAPWIILCDFDGTISLEDTTDVLLENFGMAGWQKLEDDWESGKIGSRECMGSQIGLLNVSSTELYQRLSQMKIDADFKQFVEVAAQLGTPLQVISDGLDSAIQFILGRYELVHLPIYANKLIEQENNRWSLEFPYAQADCLKASGNCKCARAASVKITSELTSQRILYIGDGSSDFCVSNRVDVVLAKDKLIGYCQEQGITHHAIRNFKEALALLPKILKTVPIKTVRPMTHYPTPLFN
jgi:2-hydroxy-3-keto-5-methylthiopentenyl-1-phosphate phosphatase